MAKQKQDDQLEHTYSSYVRIQDVTLKTCQKRWMIGRSGKRGSGISVLAARLDDDDDDIYFGLKTRLFLASNRLNKLLFFFKDDFGIKYPTKIDMPLNKEARQNQ